MILNVVADREDFHISKDEARAFLTCVYWLCESTGFRNTDKIYQSKQCIHATPPNTLTTKAASRFASLRIDQHRHKTTCIDIRTQTLADMALFSTRAVQPKRPHRKVIGGVVANIENQPLRKEERRAFVKCVDALC